MRTIRRYSNRKLYDTKESRYTNLTSVAQLIRQDDEDIQVVSNSDQDLTAQTLTQIIAEEEKKSPRVSVDRLTKIIRSGIIE
jgi:polyhydroxyalkanoate synthesis repressor PhaR